MSTSLDASPVFAELAQSVERKALNLVVVGSSPTFGASKTRVFCSGGLAQMAERVLSMHEVAGSMPASSTQTAILRGEYRVPSDPRSQAPSGPVSTIVGDQIGSPGAVCITCRTRVCVNALLAQWIRYLPPKQGIPGSSPGQGSSRSH